MDPRYGWMSVGFLALGPGAAFAQSAEPSVRIEHAAARVEVITEPRANISVTVRAGDPRMPRPIVRQETGTVIVDGGLRHGSVQCHGATIKARFGPITHALDHRRVHIQWLGEFGIDKLPVITAHVPLDARIFADEAVWGQVGASRSLVLTNVGCGDWSVGDVAGVLRVSLAGSGDLDGTSAQGATIKLAGSGDVHLGAIGGRTDLSLAGSGDARLGPVAGPLGADLAGSGDLQVASVSGPVKARLSGSGDMTISGGTAPTVDVVVAGSGDFSFDGTAGALSASVAGSGDVRAAHVSGLVSRNVAGSGNISVGR